jgi:uncharacterized protein
MASTIRYFATPGPENTDETLAAVRDRARELGIRQVVVASSHGTTARRAREIIDDAGVRIVAVSISAAFDAEGWTMTAAERSALEGLGITVLTGLHALGDDVSEQFTSHSPARIVRETLYTFCQGMKVAVEVALMAAEAGLLDMQAEAIAVAGTGEGADTAVVLTPAYARKVRDLRIREILAKPR